MKLRGLMGWFNDVFRPVHVPGVTGEGVRPDHEDAFVTGSEHDSAPVGWVPSQQDEGPTHDGGVL